MARMFHKPDGHIVVVAVLSVLICSLSSVADDAAPNNSQNAAQSATEDVVFQAAWGSGDSDVGLVNEPEKERCGPVAFAVDGDAVLLLDGVNGRVLRASGGEAVALATTSSASALCGDGAGGVWLVEEGQAVHVTSAGVRQALRSTASKAGKAKPQIEGYGVEVQRDPNGRVVYRLLDQECVEIAAGTKPSAASQSSEETPLTYSVKRMAGNEVRILGEDAEGKILKSIPVRLDDGTAGAVLFKGTDRDGNLYVEVERLQNGRANLEVHRYGRDGSRRALFPLRNDCFTTVYKKSEISPDGSVYQMVTLPDGVRVVRYSTGEVK